MKLICKYFIMCVFIFNIIFISGSLVLARNDKNTNNDYSQILHTLAQKKASVLSQLNKLSYSKEQTNAMEKLDSFWSSPKIYYKFSEHYKQMSEILNQVEIRDGTWDIIKAQYIAVIDDSRLKEITNNFIVDSSNELKELQENFMNMIFDEFQIFFTKQFINTQKQVSQQFDKALEKQFDYCQNLYINLRPVNVSTKEINSRVELDSNVGIKTGVGISILALSKMMRKVIIKKIGKKILGKVVAKCIPGIGAGLIAYDFWNATQAKTEMEKTLRTSFIDEYQKLFIPEIIWNESRSDIKKDFKNELTQWVSATKEKTRELLNAAILLNNLSFQHYVKKRRNENASLDEIVYEMNDLKNTFGSLASILPIDKMYNIQAQIPTRANSYFLPELIDIFDVELLDFYDKYGSNFFNVALDMGAENIQNILNNDYNLFEVYKFFKKHLSMNSSENAKKGFFIALDKNMDLSSPWNMSLFENIYHNKDLVFSLLTDDVGETKIKNIVSYKKIIPIFRELYKEDSILAGAFSRNFNVIQINSRFADPCKINKFVKLYQLNNPISNVIDADKYIRRLMKNFDILEVYIDCGKDCVKIFETYVNDNTGKEQKEMANKAITLYKKGYSVDDCIDRKSINYAFTLNSIPAGKNIFELTYPTIKNFGFIGMMIALLIILIILIIFIRIIFRWIVPIFKRKNSTEEQRIKIVDKPDAYKIKPINSKIEFQNEEKQRNLKINEE